MKSPPTRPPTTSPSDPALRTDADEIAADFKRFIRPAWAVLEPATAYIDNWHIDAICDHLAATLTGEIRNLAINIPPRSMKSLLVSVMFPAWAWLTRPHLRFLFSSYSQARATQDSIKCRRLIQSPWYQRLFGDRFRLVGDQNEKLRFENDHTGQRVATSVGGVGTGEGGDYLVTDDPNNAQEAESDTVRTGTNEWWDGTMSTRGNDPRTVVKIVIQQRLHEEDVTGHVLAKGGYVHLKIPMRYDGEPNETSIGYRDPRTEHGQLMWPARFGEAEVAQLEHDLGPRQAAGQLEQRPSPAEGALFQRLHWRYWVPRNWPHALPAVQVKLPDGSYHACATIELPATFETVLSSWDTTFKDLSTSDFVVGQVWARNGPDSYLLDQRKGRWDADATEKAIKALRVEWAHLRIGATLVEDKANGPAVIKRLRSQIPGVVAVNPQGGKESRAQATLPYQAAGNLVLPHPGLPCAWSAEFVETCAGFPGIKHDDEVDAMTQAVTHLYGLYRSRRVVRAIEYNTRMPVKLPPPVVATLGMRRGVDGR